MHNKFGFVLIFFPLASLLKIYLFLIKTVRIYNSYLISVTFLLVACQNDIVINYTDYTMNGILTCSMEGGLLCSMM